MARWRCRCGSTFVCFSRSLPNRHEFHEGTFLRSRRIDLSYAGQQSSSGVRSRMPKQSWSTKRHTGPPAAREIVKQFEDLVRKCGFQLVHQADRATAEEAKTASTRFNHLLLIGFTAAHWPLWPLFCKSAPLLVKTPVRCSQITPPEQTSFAADR